MLSRKLGPLQARAAETMAGAAPQVQRNKGTMGSKDLHLENFSVSNGGQELIEVRGKAAERF